MDKTRKGGHDMQWFVVGFAVTLGVLTLSEELVTAM